MIIVMKTTESTGASSGTVTRRKTCHSRRAVGARRLEHVARHRREPGARSPPSRSRPRSRCRRSSATGVISFVPEPGEAAPGLGEGLRRDRRVVGARARRPRSRTCRRRPPRVVLDHLAARRRAAARSRPAAPARCGSTLPGDAAAGLEVAPDDAVDVARLRPRRRPPASRRPAPPRAGSPSGRAARRRPGGAASSARVPSAASRRAPASTGARRTARRAT